MLIDQRRARIGHSASGNFMPKAERQMRMVEWTTIATNPYRDREGADPSNPKG